MIICISTYRFRFRGGAGSSSFTVRGEALFGQAGGDVRQDLVGRALDDLVGTFDQELSQSAPVVRAVADHDGVFGNCHRHRLTIGGTST